jgi:hypothetical protein
METKSCQGGSLWQLTTSPLWKTFELSALGIFIRFVMPGLDPGVHAVTPQRATMPMEWIAGSSPAMTNVKDAGA